MSELIKRLEEIRKGVELDEKQQQKNLFKEVKRLRKEKGRIETISVSKKR